MQRVVVLACKPSTWDAGAGGYFKFKASPSSLRPCLKKASLLSVIIYYIRTEILHFFRSIVLETALRLKRTLRLPGNCFPLTGSGLRDPVEGKKPCKYKHPSQVIWKHL